MIHSNSTSNHILENWTYADAAARTGATGFVAADVGKIAYQTDTGEYWRLTATTPTWALAAPLATQLSNSLLLATGTTSIAPMKFTSGTNLTSAAAGACEFDGANYYQTIDTTSGRGIVPVQQFFRLDANGSSITTIANFFGTTSNISLVASAYYLIEIDCYFTKDTGAGTVTWTFTNSAAPTFQNIHFEMSPAAGIVAPAGSAAAYLSGDIVGDATATKALSASASLSVATHLHRFKIYLKNGSGTSLKVQATVSSNGITPQKGSFWLCRRLPASSTGTFAA